MSAPVTRSNDERLSTRVGVYARISTLDQNVNVQLDELRVEAARRGWVLAAEYVDVGASGASSSRPGLDQLLVDVAAGRLDVVMCWKCDRLGRSLKHLMSTIAALTSRGVEFVALRDVGVDTTSPLGRLFIQIVGAFAEFERALGAERIRAGMQHAKAVGKHCGRPYRPVELRPVDVLLGFGHSQREVAALLGVPVTTIRRRLAERRKRASGLLAMDRSSRGGKG